MTWLWRRNCSPAAYGIRHYGYLYEGRVVRASLPGGLHPPEAGRSGFRRRAAAVCEPRRLHRLRRVHPGLPDQLGLTRSTIYRPTSAVHRSSTRRTTTRPRPWRPPVHSVRRPPCATFSSSRSLRRWLPSPPEPDQRITQTLISEIQQLRLAIERSTLLTARTQLATSQLQLQETAVARLTSQQLTSPRAGAGLDRPQGSHRRADRGSEQRRATRSDSAQIWEAKTQRAEGRARPGHGGGAESGGPRGRARDPAPDRPRTRSPTRAPASPRWSARSTPPSNMLKKK